MAYLCHRFYFILSFFCTKKKKWPWPIVAIDLNSFGPCNLFKMATARIRNNDWQEDERLIEALTRYVKDFSDYAWSLRTLDRRLQYFGIKYTDRTVQVDEVEDAVKEEMEGPGKLLGYRALHKKLRQVHDLNVPRDLVYAVMYDVDPDALAERAPQYKKKKAKGNFISRGPNWVHSLDGHDKLMGYQNSTFPIAAYGCMKQE